TLQVRGVPVADEECLEDTVATGDGGVVPVDVRQRRVMAAHGAAVGLDDVDQRRGGVHTLALCPVTRATIGCVTSTTYRSPLLDLPGAAPLQDTDALIDATGVAWHYGDPLGEQRRAHSGVVVVDRSHRRVVEVTGQDTEEFLNNLLSQKFLDTAEGFGAGALDLDIQGRILHHADVV